VVSANHPTFFIPKLEQGALFMQGKMKEVAKTAPGVIWKLLVSIFKLVKNPLNSCISTFHPPRQNLAWRTRTFPTDNRAFKS